MEPPGWIISGGGRSIALQKFHSLTDVVLVLAGWWQVWPPYFDEVNGKGWEKGLTPSESISIVDRPYQTLDVEHFGVSVGLCIMLITPLKFLPGPCDLRINGDLTGIFSSIVFLSPIHYPSRICQWGVTTRWTPPS